MRRQPSSSRSRSVSPSPSRSPSLNSKAVRGKLLSWLADLSIDVLAAMQHGTASAALAGDEASWFTRCLMQHKWLPKALEIVAIGLFFSFIAVFMYSVTLSGDEDEFTNFLMQVLLPLVGATICLMVVWVRISMEFGARIGTFVSCSPISCLSESGEDLWSGFLISILLPISLPLSFWAGFALDPTGDDGATTTVPLVIGVGCF